MRCFLLLLLLFLTPTIYSAEVVLGDSELGIQKEELIVIVNSLPVGLIKKLKKDKVYRNDLLLKVLMNKKIARELDRQSADFDDAESWELKIAVETAKREMYFRRFIRNIEYPDFTAFAEEQYHTYLDKYARVDEVRFASQILIKCSSNTCDSDSKGLIHKIEKELEEGVGFDELAKKYSQDEFTKDKGGVIRLGISEKDPSKDIDFRKQLFKLKNVGDVSAGFKSRFGYHIIKLEKIEASYVKKFSEVKQGMIDIFKDLYKRLSLRSLNQKFVDVNLVKFNGKEIDSIFEKINNDGLMH